MRILFGRDFKNLNIVTQKSYGGLDTGYHGARLDVYIEEGDEVEVDFDNGMIYNRTKGTEFKGQPFPEFMQKLIAAGGLVKYTNSKKAK